MTILTRPRGVEHVFTLDLAEFDEKLRRLEVTALANGAHMLTGTLARRETTSIPIRRLKVHNVLFLFVCFDLAEFG